MQIDVHWHHIPKAYVEAVLSRRTEFDGEVVRSGDNVNLVLNMGFDMPLTPDLFEVELAVEALDQAGHTAVLAALPPPLMHYEVPPTTGLRVSQQVNDAWAATAAEAPDRIFPLAQVPLQDAELAAQELRRAMQDLGFRGAAIKTNVMGANLGDDSLLPFWETARDLDAFVFIHPQTPLGIDRLRRHQMINFVGLPIDTAVAVASLVFEGVYAKLPGLKTCFAHGGGAFPYLLGRWDHGFTARRSAGFRITEEPSSYLSDIYCDSLAHSPAGLRFLIETIGAEQVLLGSDHPFDMGDPDPAGTLRQAVDDSAVCEMVAGATAARLAGLE